MAQNFRYPNLVTLNGVALTDESRKPLTEDRDERSNLVDLASGTKRKFVKGVGKRWSIEWDNVAMAAEWTVDGFGGRNEIRDIAEGAGEITFFMSDGRNPDETWTVFVDSYNETVLQRHGEGDQFRYTISLALTSVTTSQVP